MFLLVGIFCLTLLSFISYIYSAPRSFPHFAKYVEKEFIELLPEQTVLKIEDFVVGADKSNYRIFAKILGVHFSNSVFGSFDLPEVALSINPLGLLPSHNSSLFDLQMSSLEGELKRQVESSSFNPEMFSKINAYIEAHKNKLKYLSFSFDNLSWDIDYFSEKKKINFHEVTIQPVLVEERLFFSLIGEMSFGIQMCDVNIRIGLESNNVLHVDPKINFPKNSYFEGQFEVDLEKTTSVFKGAYLAKNLSLPIIKEFWPGNIAKSTYDWVFKHISEADISASEGSFSIDAIEPGKPLHKDSIQVVAHINNTKLQYMDNVSAAENISATLSFNESSFKFDVGEGKLGNVNIVKVLGEIPDLNAEKKVLKIDGKARGELKDSIDLGYQHAGLTNKDFLNIKGYANSSISLEVPLNDDQISLKKLGLEVHSELSKVKVKDLYKDYFLEDGNLSLDLQSSVLKIQGDGKLNGELSSHLETVFNFSSGDKIYLLKSDFNWSELEKIGFKAQDFFTEKTSLEIYRSEKDKQSKTVIQFDLRKTNFQFPKMNLSKKVDQDGFIRVDIHTDDSKKIPNFIYSVKLGNFESTGVGSLDDEMNKVTRFESYSMKVRNSDGKDALMKALYVEPKLVLRSEDFGLALNAFGLSDKFNKGHFVFDGVLLPEIKGQVILENFQVKKLPFIVKILGAATVLVGSFKSILLLSEKGIEFREMKSEFHYKEGLLKILSLNAEGDILYGNIDGEVDFKNDTSHLNGRVVPSNILNDVIKNMPVLGRKVGPPVVIGFNLRGPIQDPEVNVKSVSEVFSKTSRK